MDCLLLPFLSELRGLKQIPAVSATAFSVRRSSNQSGCLPDLDRHRTDPRFRKGNAIRIREFSFANLAGLMDNCLCDTLRTYRFQSQMRNVVLPLCHKLAFLFLGRIAMGSKFLSHKLPLKRENQEGRAIQVNNRSFCLSEQQQNEQHGI